MSRMCGKWGKRVRMETKRLILRDFREEDADDLYAILGDAETMACLEPAYDREKTRAFLASFCIGARGALAAAQYLITQSAGLYQMSDLLRSQEE